MKTFVIFLARFFLKVIFYLYYSFMSFKDHFKTKKYSNVKLKKEFNGGKVMLLALYEKASLRNDTLELLKEAKRNDLFIIAVNTLRLEEQNYPTELVDVYIERDNFGRDFGSYKEGMKYFFDNGFDDKSERLLIFNDSVFFSKRGLSAFIDKLSNTNIEVLGATENSQIAHHLGSFCISVSGKVARNPKFKAYWQNYKKSNVRPKVIKQGEFALSKVLKSITSSELHYKSLYNVSFMEEKLNSDVGFYKDYYSFRREGDFPWRNKSITGLIANDEVLSSFYNKFIIEKNGRDDLALSSNEIIQYNKNNKKYEVSESKKIDYLGAVDFFRNSVHKDQSLDMQFKKKLIAIYLDEFTVGSQIHVNCIALHNCGLPIIKLDLMFRGICNMNDIITLRDQLDDSQKDEFMTLILARLNGSRFLFGLNRLAFQFGIL